MADESPNENIVHRQLDTSREEPIVELSDVVADLEGTSTSELTPVYDQLDHVIDYIFSNPPVPEAQVQITFTYEGYRITVEQDGSAQFVKVD
jgi:hypothetical protein